MAIIRPRLNDFHGLAFTQAEVDFAIPFVNEDIPLYIDPFLLWKSPSQQDQALHMSIISAMNHLGALYRNGKEEKATSILIAASECAEIGLGTSNTRVGHRIGQKTAAEILSVFSAVPQLRENGISHLEEIQLIIDKISSDRISDIAGSFLKSFLIDYTIDQCRKLGIPCSNTAVRYQFEQRSFSLKENESLELPINPDTGEPIIFVPKRWLRFIPWINYDDYFSNSHSKTEFEESGHGKVEVLTFNRLNYDEVLAYVASKERGQADCKNDPLFTPIPVVSAKRKLHEIKKLPTGKDDNADKKYEEKMCQLMASLLYPQLDFAQEQVRSESGVSIRDLVFYNNRSYPLLRTMYDDYHCRQVVFELKNVRALERDHIFQLNRYLADHHFGRFGIFVTRNRPERKIRQSLIDLWSGQRKCILVLTDADIEQMVDIFESKQRLPIDVLTKVYTEFTKTLPV